MMSAMIRWGVFKNRVEGVERTDLVKLPPAALRSGYQVYVVDGERRLRLRTVEVLRSDRDGVLVSSGLSVGERVLVAGVELPVEGMRVGVVGQDAGQ